MSDSKALRMWAIQNDKPHLISYSIKNDKWNAWRSVAGAHLEDHELIEEASRLEAQGFQAVRVLVAVEDSA